MKTCEDIVNHFINNIISVQSEAYLDYFVTRTFHNIIIINNNHQTSRPIKMVFSMVSSEVVLLLLFINPLEIIHCHL